MQRNDLALNNCGVILTEDHEYWLGDKRLTGITGIISRQLFPDKYKAVPEKVLKAALVIVTGKQIGRAHV